MVIYPAIDIKNGKCVRLVQGLANQETVYGDNPAEMATRWVDAGAEYIHVVDLDGAFDGKGKNGEAIQAIVKAAGNVPIQLGGGIRTLDDIRERLDWGVARVIIGSAAISNPDMVEAAAKQFPEQIVAGIDAKDGMVAVHGWVDISDLSAIDLAKKLYAMGIHTCVYTDISKDGMLTGPNIDATTTLKDESGMDVIASGGIGTLDDLRAVKARGISGAIVGKALYNGNVTLAECLEVARD